MEGSISSKALFYDENLPKGTIVYTDDAYLTDDIIATLRSTTSDYQEETIHRTVNGERKIDVFRIPPRVTFWMSTVDSIQDEQLATRFFFGDTDGSETQDIKVNKNQKKRVTTPYSIENDPDVLTCRCIFDTIFQNEYSVFVPCADAITWNDMEHRRNFDKFLDLLQAVTLFNFKQRKTAYGGIVSTLDDFDRAIGIYNGTSANNATNLNGKEMAIMKCIQGSINRTITFTEIQEKTGFKETSLRYTIDGRNGKEGLLGKVKGLYKLDKNETVSLSEDKKETTKSTVYKYNGDLFEVSSKLFQSVATIDRDKAERLTCEFIEADNENTHNSHNSHTTLTQNVRDKNDCSKDNISNNNTIITNIGEREGNCENTENQNDDSFVDKNVNNFSCDSSMRDICEDSPKIGQLMTKANVRDDVRGLTMVSNDNENKYESCVRVEEKTRVVHCQKEPYDIYIGRAMPNFRLKESKWHNPFKEGKDGTLQEVIEKYKVYLQSKPELLEAIFELKGKVLGCWCKPLPCHGDFLAELANKEKTKNTDSTIEELLRKALKNYAWSSEYNGVVESIPAFVSKFNERTPEYKQGLGFQAVLSNAERLSARGWK